MVLVGGSGSVIFIFVVEVLGVSIFVLKKKFFVKVLRCMGCRVGIRVVNCLVVLVFREFF